jgi:hypothetical protein
MTTKHQPSLMVVLLPKDRGGWLENRRLSPRLPCDRRLLNPQNDSRPLPVTAQATECVFRRSDLSPTAIALDAGRDPKPPPQPPAIAGGRTNYLLRIRGSLCRTIGPHHRKDPAERGWSYYKCSQSGYRLHPAAYGDDRHRTKS